MEVTGNPINRVDVRLKMKGVAKSAMSAYAAFITSQTINVDGGKTFHLAGSNPISKV